MKNRESANALKILNDVVWFPTKEMLSVYNIQFSGVFVQKKQNCPHFGSRRIFSEPSSLKASSEAMKN